MNVAISTKELFSTLVGEQKAEELSKYDLSFLARQDNKFFKSIGLTTKKADTLQVVFEICRRKAMNDATHVANTFRSANDVYQFMQPQMIDLSEEHFRVLLMDTSCNLLGVEEISVGGIDATIVDLRVLFKKIVMSGASRFIAVHNHPSGNPSASRPDKELTQRIAEASKTMMIRFDDHIIIGRNAYYSFNEEGLI